MVNRLHAYTKMLKQGRVKNAQTAGQREEKKIANNFLIKAWTKN